MIGRDHLLDVSRLVWRLWSGRLPTGIDRVCLEYLAHFGDVSRAVLQFRGRIVVLSPTVAAQLFALLGSGARGFRWRLVALGVRAMFGRKAIQRVPQRGAIYLNVGHTGLDQPALVRWVELHGLRAFYLVHDLIPITHPHYCRDGEAEKHADRMRNALASATGIICNSQATLDELVAFAGACGLPMPPSIVAFIAPPQLCLKDGPPPCRGTYFVAVGTIEARKNHRLLLEVWRRLVADMGERAPVLVVVGQRGWQADEEIAILETPGDLRGHLVEVGDCTDEELARWIAGARALLMPSHVEGFGLPVVEALQLSTPVIASDLPVYREIAGAIPTYLDPDDERAWRTAVIDFIDSAADRDRQLSASRTYEAPSWEGHFARVDRFLDEVQRLETAPRSAKRATQDGA